MEEKVTEIYRSLHKGLHKMITLHRQLLDVMRTERENLIQADLRAIEITTQAKQKLIDDIRQAETERQKIVFELAIQLKKPIRELSLSNIILLVQGIDLRIADQLRSALTTLSMLVQRILGQNHDNAALLEQSLEHVAEMKKNVLGEAVPLSDIYSPNGQKSAGIQGARLISKEA